MPRGDCENAFQAAALADGIPLIRASFAWINQRGHYGLPREAAAAEEVMEKIFEALGGLGTEQAAKRLTKLPGDFVHVDSGVCIEIDESQHFTSFRLATLDLYPDDVSLGYDLEEYKSLCREWAPKSDKYRAAKPAAGFGEGGRQRQRAYNDALRDLATPAMGLPPVIRVAAPHRDGAEAYARVRDRVRAAIRA